MLANLASNEEARGTRKVPKTHRQGPEIYDCRPCRWRSGHPAKLGDIEAAEILKCADYFGQALSTRSSVGALREGQCLSRLGAVTFDKDPTQLRIPRALDLPPNLGQM